MKKLRYRFVLDFDLNLKNGEELDLQSIKEFQKKLKLMPHNWDGYFYAYFDGINDSYDKDVIPTNIKCSTARRK